MIISIVMKTKWLPWWLYYTSNAYYSYVLGGLHLLNGLMYGLLMMIKLAGSPACAKDAGLISTLRLKVSGVLNIHKTTDIKVFNFLAKPIENVTSLHTVYSQLEQFKRKFHDQCIHNMEHGSFTPLIFPSTGNIGRSANITFRGLASYWHSNRVNLTVLS